mgnify:CR=1 FL=1
MYSSQVPDTPFLMDTAVHGCEVHMDEVVVHVVTWEDLSVGAMRCVSGCTWSCARYVLCVGMCQDSSCDVLRSERSGCSQSQLC